MSRWVRTDGKKLTAPEGSMLERQLEKEEDWTSAGSSPPSPSPEEQVKPELSGMTRVELDEVAIEAGIKSPDAFRTKAEVIAAINGAAS